MFQDRLSGERFQVGPLVTHVHSINCFKCCGGRAGKCPVMQGLRSGK